MTMAASADSEAKEHQWTTWTGEPFWSIQCISFNGGGGRGGGGGFLDSCIHINSTMNKA